MITNDEADRLIAENPGVQGLAQLGRNAIERVAELEANIAMIARAIDVNERVQIGDLLSRLHALLAERDALKLRAEQAEARLEEIDAAPVAEMREPTPEECERIARESTVMMATSSTYEQIGRAMFNAVEAVMGGEK